MGSKRIRSRKKNGEQNQTIYNLMYHKLYWMWANNVTDYKR